MMAFGDDQLTNVAKDLLEIVNQPALIEAFKEIGMDYTSADKESTPPLHKTLDKCTFLKRGFRKVWNSWLAPLDLNVVLETLMWTKDGVPADDEHKKVDHSLFELSLHPKEVFTQWSSKIISLSNKFYDHQPAIVDYLLCRAKAAQLAVFC